MGFTIGSREVPGGKRPVTRYNNNSIIIIIIITTLSCTGR